MRRVVLALLGLFLGVWPALADEPDVICGYQEGEELQGGLQTSSNPADPLVEARVVFITFPSHAQQTKPSWAFSFRADMVDFIDKMSRGNQKMSLLVLSPPGDTTKAWLADHPGSYYKALSNGFGVLNTEIMTKIANQIPGVWTGIEHVFIISYEDVFIEGYAGLWPLRCNASPCAPGFTGNGTQQIMLSPNPEDPIEAQSTRWIASHEYGHAVGFFHSPGTQPFGRPIGTDCHDVNMGRYDCMRGIGSFIREGGLVPYHPQHLVQANWLPKTVVTTDQIGLRIPAMFGPDARMIEVPIPGVANQRYWLANFQQATPYDTKYNNRGLLIWHVIDGQAWDLECAEGKFVKTGNCALNLSQPDPSAGSDLLEACFSALGAPNNFYDGTTGTQLTGCSNPNTSRYTGDYCTAQSASTGVSFENIHRDPANGDMIVDIYLTPKQTVLSPNGGEVLPVNTSSPLTWQVRPNACISSVDIQWSTNGGASYSPLISNIPNTGSVSWSASSPGTQYRLRVKSHGPGGIDGQDESDANFTLVNHGAWELLASTHPNGGRSEHGAVYDSLRARMVIFGGHTSAGTNLNDVWAKPVLGTAAWQQITTSGTAPSARYNPAVVYDKLRDRILVYGGRTSGFSTLNDCFALTLSGTPTWSALPSNSFGFGADRFGVYDSRRDRLVVVDPDIGVAALTLSGTPAWSTLTNQPPPNIGELGYTLIYDSARDKLVIFGGWTPSNNPYIYFNGVAEFSFANNTWTALSPTNPPHIQAYGTAVYDPLRSRMVLFGGYYYEAGTDHYLNSTMELTLGATNAWSTLVPGGTKPSARKGHSGVYDSIDDALAIFGGQTGPTTFAQDARALVFPDIRPPDPVVVGAGTGRFNAAVFWNVPGDDGMLGQASTYDMRYSTSPINEGNFFFMAGQQGDVLDPPGSPICVEVTGLLQCTRYYFAVKHQDDAGNWSPISNVPSSQTKCSGGMIIACDVLSAQSTDEPEVPKVLELRPPMPNPADNDAVLEFDVPRSLVGRSLQLAVFDVLGRKIRKLEDHAAGVGRFESQWDLKSDAGLRVAPGLYFTRLVVGDRRLTRTIMVR